LELYLKVMAWSLERILGPRNTILLQTLRSLAAASARRGRADLAEQALLHIIAVEESNRPSRPREIAAISKSLGELYLTPRRAQEARAAFERALQLLDGYEEVACEEVAIVLDGLAQAYRLLHMDHQAEPLLRRALSLRESALGPDHQNVLDSLTRLGQLLSDLGKYDEAEVLLERVVHGQESTHGSTHLAVAAALDNLALLLDQKGEFARSEVLYRRAVTIERLIMKRPGFANVHIEGHRPAGPLESPHGQG
jgi:tetratricopeptide (TPR) repeat protein